MTKATAARPAARRGRLGGRSQFQEEQRRQSREAILAAAAEIFAKTPYVYATIDDIIRAAGVGRATFYVYFESKLSLAVAIYEGVADDWLVLFDQLATLRPLDLPQLEQWIRALAQLYVDHGFVTPLVAQLEIFEESFRYRLRQDRDLLIERLANAGVSVFAAAFGSDEAARILRARAHLLLRRIDQVCGETLQLEVENRDEADAYISILAEEMRAFLET